MTVFLLLVFKIYRSENKVSEKETPEKEIQTAQADWGYISFDSAVEEASSIVYGKVAERGKTVIYEHINSSGRLWNEYFTEITIDVIDVLKGDPNIKTVHYLEMGGETDTAIHTVDGIEPILPGEKYVFFLNKYDCFLSPWTLQPI